MQRGGTILNPRLAAAVVGLGHGQTIVVCDAGLPLPAGAPILDLSLVAGVPGFLQTLEALAGTLAVEQVIVARELEQVNGEMQRRVAALWPDVPLRQVSHAELKALVGDARLVVRTGECSPYANAILVGGVTF
jgi:D-ribose pyranase